MTRQFARTVTAQKPLSSPFSGRRPNVGSRSASIVSAQHSQNLAEFTDMLGIHAFCRAVLKELPQSPMLEALDHVSPIVRLDSVNRCFTSVKRYFTLRFLFLAKPLGRRPQA
jgi:hypothetical protein